MLICLTHCSPLCPQIPVLFNRAVHTQRQSVGVLAYSRHLCSDGAGRHKWRHEMVPGSIQYVCWTLVSLASLRKSPPNHRGKVETMYPQITLLCDRQGWRAEAYGSLEAVIVDLCMEMKFTETSWQILKNHSLQFFRRGLQHWLLWLSLVVYLPLRPSSSNTSTYSPNNYPVPKSGIQSSFWFTEWTLVNILICSSEKHNTMWGINSLAV